MTLDMLAQQLVCSTTATVQAAEHAKEVKRLNQLLQALEMASMGDATALLADQDDAEGVSWPSATLASKGRQGLQAAGAKVSLAEIKQQLQRQLKQQVCLKVVGNVVCPRLCQSSVALQ
jgi:hypothetical protein